MSNLVRAIIAVTAIAGSIWTTQQIVQARADAETERTAKAADRQARTRLMRHLVRVNPEVQEQAGAIVDAAYRCGQERGLDPRLLLAVIEIETHYRVRDIGEDGERGLMQITRGTAHDVGVPWTAAFDIETNICGGAQYLKMLRDRHGDLDKVLRHYNGGAAYPARVLARYAAIVSDE